MTRDSRAGSTVLDLEHSEVGPKRYCFSNACLDWLNPILDSTSSIPERQPPMCLADECGQARRGSIDPSSGLDGASEGALCYSGPTVCRTRK